MITVEWMLTDGMLVDLSDGYWAAIHPAAIKNRTAVVKRLLHEQADVNRQTTFGKDTPLHIAARYNHSEVARLLLNNGADIKLKNNNKKTPLDEARNGSKIESLLLQLQQSAL